MAGNYISICKYIYIIFLSLISGRRDICQWRQTVFIDQQFYGFKWFSYNIFGYYSSGAEPVHSGGDYLLIKPISY